MIKIGDKAKIKADHFYHANKNVTVTFIGIEDYCNHIAVVMQDENKNIRFAVKIKDLILSERV